MNAIGFKKLDAAGKILPFGTQPAPEAKEAPQIDPYMVMGMKAVLARRLLADMQSVLQRAAENGNLALEDGYSVYVNEGDITVSGTAKHASFDVEDQANRIIREFSSVIGVPRDVVAQLLCLIVEPPRGDGPNPRTPIGFQQRAQGPSATEVAAAFRTALESLAAQDDFWLAPGFTVEVRGSEVVVSGVCRKGKVDPDSLMATAEALAELSGIDKAAVANCLVFEIEDGNPKST